MTNPQFQEYCEAIRRQLLGALAQMKKRIAEGMVTVMPTREAREAAFLALRPRFDPPPEYGYFSRDCRAIPQIWIVIRDGHMQARAWRERTQADFFAVN